MYPDYLIHFNKNHSKANGQFVRGDGDGDGTGDEHHRYSKNGVKSTSNQSSRRQEYNPQKEQMKTIANNSAVTNMAAKVVCSAARKAAGFAFSKTKLGKTLKEIGAKDVGKEFVKVTELDKIAKDSGLTDAKKQLESKIQGKVAEGLRKGANKAIDKYY